MMTALLASRNVVEQRFDIWCVNTDAEYHEEGGEASSETAGRLTPKKLEAGA